MDTKIYTIVGNLCIGDISCHHWHGQMVHQKNDQHLGCIAHDEPFEACQYPTLQRRPGGHQDRVHLRAVQERRKYLKC